VGRRQLEPSGVQSPAVALLVTLAGRGVTLAWFISATRDEPTTPPAKAEGVELE